MNKQLITAILLSVVLSATSCLKKIDPAPTKPIDTTRSNPTDTTKTPIDTTKTQPAVDSLKIGLIAHYAFNDNSTSNAIDSSGNGNTATAFNITLTTDRLGKPNAAYSFNGQSSFLVVKDNAALRLNNTDFTINSWVNLKQFSFSSGSFVLSKRASGSANGWGSSVTGFAVNGTNIIGAPFFNVSGGTDPAAVGVSSVKLNNWYMLTTVYSVQKHQIRLYINGILNSTTDNIPTPNALTAANMYIGSDNPDTGSDGYYFNGGLDDIRLYSRALNVSDIQKLYSYAK